MSFTKKGLSIFLLLFISRLIPHSPNFTSLIALNFYTPALLGLNFLPIFIISFVITDLFLGLHPTILFTWGSSIIIGLVALKFKKTLISRMLGVLISSFIYFFITNFGVWLVTDLYETSLAGVFQCYALALPFFSYTIISSLIFSTLIETIYFYKKEIKKLIMKI